MAEAFFAAGNVDAFLVEAEHAIALNSNNAPTLAALGNKFVWASKHERGTALTRKAVALNPYHPSWYFYTDSAYYYLNSDYENALAAALKIEWVGLHWTQMLLAASYGQLGRIEEARSAIEKLLELSPNYADDAWREFQTFNLTIETRTRFAEGLSKAGLNIRITQPIVQAPSRPVIAVLPFDNMSGDPGQEYFADGITEDIITRLARLPYMGVIASNSSFQYKGKNVDIRSIAAELGATYVLEGSVRRSETKIRVAAQLLQASDGTHIWAETYDRDLTADNIFAVQDDITERVVGAIGSSDSVLTLAEMRATESKAPSELSSYECNLRAGEYWRVITPEVHLVVRDCLDRVLKEEPEYAGAWSNFAGLTIDEFLYGYNPRPEMAPPLERALAYAQRAIDLDPSYGWAHWNLAKSAFYRHNMRLFHSEIDRALELAPNDAEMLAATGHFLAYSGSWERGMSLMAKAIELNPYHQPWYYFPYFYDAYRQGLDDAGAHQTEPRRWSGGRLRATRHAG